MTWLLVTVSFYLILAVVFLVDKYLLSGAVSNPKVYTFYVGTLGILILAIIPFVGFYIPPFPQIVLALLAGASFIFAMFWFYKALNLFEASRVVPAISGLVPLFTFGLVFVSSFGKERLSFSDIIAFLLLTFGSFLMVLKKEKFISLESFKISTICAFLLSFSFVLLKYVYLAQSFWTGFIWTKIGGFLMALCFFVFTKEVKEEILKQKIGLEKKTMGIFVINQVAGGTANVLQNWAFALVPLAYIAVINALQGIQYVFLLIFTVFLSLTQPFWAKRAGLKEEISKKILFQKIIAILLIGAGLALLAF